MCTLQGEISCLVAVKILLTILEEIRSDDGLEKAETCRLINYTVVLCVTYYQEIHTVLSNQVMYNQGLRRQCRYTINSVALVREGTIPTERPPSVGEVSANFCG